MGEKMDWQICIKPAETEEKILVTGYLKLPNRGEVNFTATFNSEEFATVLESVQQSINSVLAQIAERAAKETGERKQNG